MMLLEKDQGLGHVPSPPRRLVLSRPTRGEPVKLERVDPTCHNDVSCGLGLDCVNSKSNKLWVLPFINDGASQILRSVPSLS